MVNADTQIRAIRLYSLFCAFKRFKLRAFDVHIDKSRMKAMEDMIYRNTLNAGLPRCQDS